MSLSVKVLVWPLLVDSPLVISLSSNCICMYINTYYTNLCVGICMYVYTVNSHDALEETVLLNMDLYKSYTQCHVTIKYYKEYVVRKYVYVYTYVRTYVMYIFLNICICTYIRMHVCMCIHMYVCTCVCVCVCVHIYVHVSEVT